jgi:hypothetical protein
MEDHMQETQERVYMLRVVRVPLDPVTREKMRHDGTLPDDHMTRAVEAHDFTQVTARNDADAAAQAKLKVRIARDAVGERIVVEESMPDDSYREIA